MTEKKLPFLASPLHLSFRLRSASQFSGLIEKEEKDKSGEAALQR